MESDDEALVVITATNGSEANGNELVLEDVALWGEEKAPHNSEVSVIGVVSGGVDKTRRLVWTKMKRTVSKDGQVRTIFPFLSDDNWQDKVFIRHLLCERPYVADHGGVTASWNAVVDGATKEIHPDNGQPIFAAGISQKAFRSRFTAYMEFVKWHQSKVPFHSGADDELPATEILEGLELIYEEWSSFNKIIKIKQEATTAKKQQDKNDKIGAEVLRQAALGEYIARHDDDVGGEDDAEIVNAGFASTPAASKPHGRRYSRGTSANSTRSNTPIPGNTSNSTPSLEENFMQRMNVQLLMEENKKKKLDLQQQVIESERAEREQRLQLDRERFELDRQNQEAQRQLLLALTQQLQRPGSNDK